MWSGTLHSSRRQRTLSGAAKTASTWIAPAKGPPDRDSATIAPLVAEPEADGWEPLCRFLGTPVLAAPYPPTNNRAEFFETVNDPADPRLLRT